MSPLPSALAAMSRMMASTSVQADVVFPAREEFGLSRTITNEPSDSTAPTAFGCGTAKSGTLPT